MSMKLRSLSIYFIFNVLSALMPILALPLFTKYMSPDDYGTWTAFSIMAMYFSTINRWEINNALKLRFSLDPEKLPLYCSTAYIFGCGELVFFGALWLITLPLNQGWLGVPAIWIFGVILLSFFRYQIVNLHQLLQLQNRAILYGIWSFLANMALYGIAILLLIYGKMDWKARAWSEVVVGAVSFMVASSYLRKDFGLRWEFSLGALFSMLKLCSPLMVSELIAYLVVTLDRLFIAKFLGTEQLGLYVVAAQLSSAMSLIFSSIAPAWEASIYRKEANNSLHIRRRLATFAACVFFVGMVLTILPTILTVILPFLTSRDYSDAEMYIFPTTFVAAAGGLFRMLKPMVVFLNKTKIFLIINCGMIFFGCAGIMVCIPVMGAAGAAYALASAYIAGGLVIILSITKWTADKSF